jgi:hypothetical protein
VLLIPLPVFSENMQFVIDNLLPDMEIPLLLLPVIFNPAIETSVVLPEMVMGERVNVNSKSP